MYWGGRGHCVQRYGNTLAVSFLFLPSVSLLFQKTVNPGLLGSEEKAPSRSSHATRGLPWIMEHALLNMTL